MKLIWINYHMFLYRSSGGRPGCGTADPHRSQGAVHRHEHPLHANRTWLHHEQGCGVWREHIQPAVTLLHWHVGGPAHRFPANRSLHIPGQQVSASFIMAKYLTIASCRWMTGANNKLNSNFQNIRLQGSRGTPTIIYITLWELLGILTSETPTVSNEGSSTSFEFYIGIKFIITANDAI